VTAEQVAAEFVHAVAWGEHTRVWDLLASDARAAVLDLATRRGMDPLLAARLRESTAAVSERDTFLADLLHGIRADLKGVDLDVVRCVEVGGAGSGTAIVRLLEDVSAELGGPVPVATVDLVAGPADGWRVLRARVGV